MTWTNLLLLGWTTCWLRYSILGLNGDKKTIIDWDYSKYGRIK